MSALTEADRNAICDNFDAWYHDYTALYPVVEEILATHHAAILTELHALARTDLVGRKSLHDAIAVVERLTPERAS